MCTHSFVGVLVLPLLGQSFLWFGKNTRLIMFNYSKFFFFCSLFSVTVCFLHFGWGVKTHTHTYITVPVSWRLVRRAWVLQRLPHITVLIFTLNGDTERKYYTPLMDNQCVVHSVHFMHSHIAIYIYIYISCICKVTWWKRVWPCAYLGLLFLDETFRRRIPVALGGCLHHTMFVVMLNIRDEEVEW